MIGHHQPDLSINNIHDLRASDWLKTSAFFMQHECKLQIARAANISSVLTFSDAFFMSIINK